jgi:hypothetical protein
MILGLSVASFPLAHVAISLIGIVAGVVVLAGMLSGRKLAGLWRPAFVFGATVALSLSVFVAVVQALLKIPPLEQAAPTQTEPPFVIAQLVTLVLFVALGFFAVRRFSARSA